VFLLEKYEDDIKGSKLPSNRQALGYFLYLHCELKKTIREASTEAVNKIEQFWCRACIPVHHKQDSVKKLEKLFGQWQGLKKNASRRTDRQIKNEEEFSGCFEDLFDIAHASALEMIKIGEDKAFLLAQRERGRRGVMTSVDNVLAKKESKLQEKLLKDQHRRQKAAQAAERVATKVLFDSSSSSGGEECDAEYSLSSCSVEESSPATPSRPKRGRTQIVTPDVVASLDRNKVSDRQALMIIGQTAMTLGHDVNSLALNRTTIRRQRQHYRAALAENIRENFQPNGPVIIHWDGKLLPELTDKDKVDRLPVLASSREGCQLLAVPKIPAGTGQAQAKAVFEVVQDWKIAEKVCGICFDTTSSNTGRLSGACVILQQLLGRSLLHLACRHHILELIAGAAFTESLGASSAPEILLFKRFQTNWKFVDQDRFENSTTDPVTESLLADVKEELIDFLQMALTQIQPREDYRELVELALIFLGKTPSRGIRFAAPGPMHQARWMSKVIYTFKVWMFRSQFRLTAREVRGLRDLCVFFAKLYVRSWMTAPVAATAPQNDLSLLQSLLAYEGIHAGISKATSRKLGGHLWYLSEELVGLSFFDNNVVPEIKDRMVSAMEDIDGDEDPPKRIDVTLNMLGDKSVADFTTKNTRSLFHKLSLPQGFLQIPASEWETNEEYQAARETVKMLAVTNDHAERGVALVQGCLGHMSKDEDQLQCLLQVVADHRKRFPQALKRNLAASNTTEK